MSEDADGTPAARGSAQSQMRVVTISREYGSGGGEIASRLARRLGWVLVDHAIVERTARELGTSVEDVETRDEATEGILDRVLEAMQTFDPGYASYSVLPEAMLSAEDYRRTMEQIVRAAAVRGQVAIVGRASQVILADRPDVLHVRVVAPFPQRVAYVMQREGVDRRTAEARIQRKDHERASYLKREYHHHPDEAQLYDLVLNTSRLDLERAVDIICFALHQIATEQASTTADLGSVTGPARYPAPPADFRPPAR
jgi:CMP/dCMP kinase